MLLRRKTAEYQLLNAILKVYPKILNFTIVFVFLFQATLYQLKLWHSALPVRPTSYNTPSLSPSGANHSILLSGCQVNNLSDICLFTPSLFLPLHQET